MKLALALSVLAALLPMPASAETPAEVAQRYGLAGEVLVAKADTVLLDRGFGTVAPGGTVMHKAGESWRLASITKQIVATMLVRAFSLATLDQPAGPSLGATSLGTVTWRQLLTHHSGLPNPDATPKGPDGVPSFYGKGVPTAEYCLSAPARPGAAFAYNNCDYILAAVGLSGDSDAPLRLWPDTHFAKIDEIGVPGYVAGKPEPHIELVRWGAAGGLIGSAPALLAFDRALMTGKLLPPDKLAALWTPEGHGSYQALGQWVFPGKLAGCANPKRIVQRDGEIYGVQTRNYILADDDLVVIVFTNRSADDFPLGEVWEGKGFVYDLLSAAACGGRA